MERLVGFMVGRWGQVTYVAQGLVLIAYGLAILGETAGLALAVVGVVLLALGLSGHCPLELFVRRQARTS